MQSLTIDDFALAFGVTTLPEGCEAMISDHDFRFESTTEGEPQKLVLETLNTLDADQFSRVEKQQRDVWKKDGTKIYRIPWHQTMTRPHSCRSTIERIHICGSGNIHQAGRPKFRDQFLYHNENVAFSTLPVRY